MRILFVCTGNTCRSPMAAYLAQSKIRARGLDWLAESAGLFAAQGMPMSPAAASALRQQDVAPDNHIAQSVTRDLVAQADVILAMTAQHAQELRRRFPEFGGKIQQLGAFVEEIPSEPDPQYDIVDPYGGSDELYRHTLAELDVVIFRLLAKLLNPEGFGGQGGS